MLIALYIGFGVLLNAALGPLDRRLPAVDEARPIDSIPGYIAVAMGGILFLLGILANLLSETRPFANASRRASWRYSSSAWW